MSQFATIIEVIFSLCLFVNAFLYVPQIITIYKRKNSQNVSLWTFGGFFVIQVFLVLHGLINRDYLLAFGYMLSILTGGYLIFLIILYRYKGNPQL